MLNYPRIFFLFSLLVLSLSAQIGELRILRLRLLEDWDVGVGVFPERWAVWVTLPYGLDSCRRTTSDSE